MLLVMSMLSPHDDSAGEGRRMHMTVNMCGGEPGSRRANHEESVNRCLTLTVKDYRKEMNAAFIIALV